MRLIAYRRILVKVTTNGSLEIHWIIGGDVRSISGKEVVYYIYGSHCRMFCTRSLEIYWTL